LHSLCQGLPTLPLPTLASAASTQAPISTLCTKKRRLLLPPLNLLVLLRLKKSALRLKSSAFMLPSS
jgi:hypothetical protein